MLWRLRNYVTQPPASEQRSVPLAQAASACACKIKDCIYFYLEKEKDRKLSSIEITVDYFKS